MAKMFGIFACLLIVALDAIAGILGIKAEAAQNQEKHLRLWLLECKEPSHNAFVLGVAAVCLLAIAHVLANLLGGCSVCTTDDIKKAPPSRQLSIACLVFTWYVFNPFIHQSWKCILRLILSSFFTTFKMNSHVQLTLRKDYLGGGRQFSNWKCVICFIIYVHFFRFIDFVWILPLFGKKVKGKDKDLLRWTHLVRV